MTLIGTYTSNTTINVSSYNASSTSEFLAVASSGSAGYNGIIAAYGSAQILYNTITFTSPTLSLSGDTLTVTVAKISGTHTWHDGSASGSANISTKVYYVGKIS